MGKGLGTPHLVHDLERMIEIATSAVEVAAGYLVVVWSATGRQAERKTTTRDLVDAGRGLRQQYRWVDRSEQDVGHQ